VTSLRDVAEEVASAGAREARGALGVRRARYLVVMVGRALFSVLSSGGWAWVRASPPSRSDGPSVVVVAAVVVAAVAVVVAGTVAALVDVAAVVVPAAVVGVAAVVAVVMAVVVHCVVVGEVSLWRGWLPMGVPSARVHSTPLGVTFPM